MRFAGHLAKVVALAKTQVGYVEGKGNRTKFGEWFGWNGVAWCAIYCSWLFALTGHQLPPLSNSKGVAYVPLVKQRAQETGQWRGPSYNPKPGDLVIFWFTNRPDHIEVVGEKGRLPDGRVHTYGGNTNYAGSRTGGMCVEAYRRSNIHGFVAVDDLGGSTTPPPYVPPAQKPTPAPAPEPQSEEDDDMTKLIRCNDKAHPEFGAVWAITGNLTRTPVTAADYSRWLFLTGGEANQAQVDGPTFDFFMRNYQDISSFGAVAITVLYVRTIIDRIAAKVGAK